MSDAPLLSVRDLVRHYPLPRERLFGPPPMLHAVNGVSFTVTRGRSMGLVGESGSGKSTIARIAVALDRPTSGRVMITGQDPFALKPNAVRGLRRHAQMIFQDPYGSLDPRRTVGWSVAEPLAALTDLSPVAQRKRTQEVLAAVGLSATTADRYPHEFSGGQRQRIACARALITRPQLIVADEPVSALDVSVRAQVLNLLRDLQERHNVTLLMISHDLAVIDYLCDDLIVLKDGLVVESGPTASVLAAPRHPYTAKLISAAARKRGA
jgi:ABC-type oligopeptide transport system ATPase subunit